ncbi:hypothetical protein BCR22_03930 [Enterococcus plantarum]|uniref:hypothetical protein n=1 Tax=Enterococcus plantarum TaxID=1077675 RepID=UPI00084CF31C|nr:hypothetical protein [Enterococcus plantarum]OEG13397.1 hypothetical protein BCR22_03930 [Enterococcus plantarum]
MNFVQNLHFYLHDLFYLTKNYVEKNGTIDIAKKFCESYYDRHYYLLLYYFLLARITIEELLKDESFDIIKDAYEDNEPIKELSEIKFDSELQGKEAYYYPNVGWGTILYYAFMNAYREYAKWEEIPNNKKSTKKYQDIESIEKRLNIYAIETKDNAGICKLKIFLPKQSKATSEKTRRRLYSTRKISRKKDYSEEFYLIDRYYDRLAQNRKYSIKDYLVEEEITKTYFFKLKKEYFKQKPLNKYYKAYKYINSAEYGGDFSKVKQDYKISKRKMDIFVNRYFPKFDKS